MAKYYNIENDKFVETFPQSENDPYVLRVGFPKGPDLLWAKIPSYIVEGNQKYIESLPWDQDYSFFNALHCSFLMGRHCDGVVNDNIHFNNNDKNNISLEENKIGAIFEIYNIFTHPTPNFLFTNGDFIFRIMDILAILVRVEYGTIDAYNKLVEEQDKIQEFDEIENNPINSILVSLFFKYSNMSLILLNEDEANNISFGPCNIDKDYAIILCKKGNYYKCCSLRNMELPIIDTMSLFNKNLREGDFMKAHIEIKKKSWRNLFNYASKEFIEFYKLCSFCENKVTVNQVQYLSIKDNAFYYFDPRVEINGKKNSYIVKDYDLQIGQSINLQFNMRTSNCFFRALVNSYCKITITGNKFSIYSSVTDLSMDMNNFDSKEKYYTAVQSKALSLFNEVYFDEILEFRKLLAKLAEEEYITVENYNKYVDNEIKEFKDIYNVYCDNTFTYYINNTLALLFFKNSNISGLILSEENNINIICSNVDDKNNMIILYEKDKHYKCCYMGISRFIFNTKYFLDSHNLENGMPIKKLRKVYGNRCLGEYEIVTAEYPDPAPIPDPVILIPDPAPIPDPVILIPDPAPKLIEVAPVIPDPVILIPDPAPKLIEVVPVMPDFSIQVYKNPGNFLRKEGDINKIGFKIVENKLEQVLVNDDPDLIFYHDRLYKTYDNVDTFFHRIANAKLYRTEKSILEDKKKGSYFELYFNNERIYGPGVDHNKVHEIRIALAKFAEDKYKSIEVYNNFVPNQKIDSFSKIYEEEIIKGIPKHTYKMNNALESIFFENYNFSPIKFYFDDDDNMYLMCNKIDKEYTIMYYERDNTYDFIILEYDNETLAYRKKMNMRVSPSQFIYTKLLDSNSSDSKFRKFVKFLNINCGESIIKPIILSKSTDSSSSSSGPAPTPAPEPVKPQGQKSEVIILGLKDEETFGYGNCFFDALYNIVDITLKNGNYLFNISKKREDDKTQYNKVYNYRRLIVLLRYELSKLAIEKYKTTENYNKYIEDGEPRIEDFSDIYSEKYYNKYYFITDVLMSLFFEYSNISVLILNEKGNGEIKIVCNNINKPHFIILYKKGPCYKSCHFKDVDAILNSNILQNFQLTKQDTLNKIINAYQANCGSSSSSSPVVKPIKLDLHIIHASELEPTSSSSSSSSSGTTEPSSSSSSSGTTEPSLLPYIGNVLTSDLSPDTNPTLGFSKYMNINECCIFYSSTNVLEVQPIARNENSFFNSLANNDAEFTFDGTKINMKTRGIYDIIRQKLFTLARNKYERNITAYNEAAGTNDDFFHNIIRPDYPINIALIKLLIENSNISIIMLEDNDHKISVHPHFLNIRKKQYVTLILKNGNYYNNIIINGCDRTLTAKYFLDAVSVPNALLKFREFYQSSVARNHMIIDCNKVKVNDQFIKKFILNAEINIIHLVITNTEPNIKNYFDNNIVKPLNKNIKVYEYLASNEADTGLLCKYLYSVFSDTAMSRNNCFLVIPNEGYINYINESKGKLEAIAVTHKEKLKVNVQDINKYYTYITNINSLCYHNKDKQTCINLNFNVYNNVNILLSMLHNA